jgi:protein-S-isoprenylcysteine O-methyltransferase Ste14
MLAPGLRKAYAVTVAFVTAFWWAFILSVPQVKALFLWPTLPERALLAFLPADILFFILVPLIWSVKQSEQLWNMHRFSIHYGAAVTISACLLTRGGWLGGVLMALAALGAEIASRPMDLPLGVREARVNSPTHNLLKTLFQVSVMWAIFLLFLPRAIFEVERSMGISQLPLVPVAIPWAIFWICGFVGFYSGTLFAVYGKGTPLPLDATSRFLVMGPYRFIRNPMATLGVIQVLCVAALYRSPLIILYCLIGAILWHLFARPWEEEDLQRRFGASYTDYRNTVHNWMPLLRPYPKTILEKDSEPIPKT